MYRTSAHQKDERDRERQIAALNWTPWRPTLPPPPPQLKKDTCRLEERRVEGGKRILEGPTARAIQLTRSLIVPCGGNQS